MKHEYRVYVLLGYQHYFCQVESQPHKYLEIITRADTNEYSQLNTRCCAVPCCRPHGLTVFQFRQTQHVVSTPMYHPRPHRAITNDKRIQTDLWVLLEKAREKKRMMKKLSMTMMTSMLYKKKNTSAIVTKHIVLVFKDQFHSSSSNSFYYSSWNCRVWAPCVVSFGSRDDQDKKPHCNKKAGDCFQFFCKCFLCGSKMLIFCPDRNLKEKFLFDRLSATFILLGITYLNQL